MSSDRVDSLGRRIPIDAGHPRRTAEQEALILDRSAAGDTRSEIERYLEQVGKPLSRTSISRFLKAQQEEERASTRTAAIEALEVAQAKAEAEGTAPDEAMLAYKPAFTFEEDDVIREKKTIALQLRGIVVGCAPASVKVRAGTELAKLLDEIHLHERRREERELEEERKEARRAAKAAAGGRTP